MEQHGTKESRKKCDDECRKENGTELLKKKREHHQKNKESIRKKQKEQITCEFCFSLSSRSHLKRHQRTKKCVQAQQEMIDS